MPPALRLAMLCVAATAACRAPSATAPRPEPPLDLPAGVADSVASVTLPSGARLHTIVNVAAPWRAVVLEADLRCHALQAVKGSATAVGRRTTSALLGSLPPDARAIGAVNADFFAFTPNGVLTNAHIEGGRLVTGPDVKPVVWAGTGGAVGIDTLRVEGTLTTPRGTVALTRWNRPGARANGILDAAWGVAPDSTIQARTWRLSPVTVGPQREGPARDGRYVVERAWTTRDAAATGDALLLHLTARDREAVRAGDTVTVAVRVIGTGVQRAGSTVRESVGGRPILVADSALAPDVDTEGQASFRDLNPRTALGFDRNGQRVWLAVIDGRQKGRSMGMTLRQTGELLRALGAVRGINLDGGGSSALAVREADGTTRVVNRPSDATGERPVGNALVVRRTCGG